jgi:hypothetical protein
LREWAKSHKKPARRLAAPQANSLASQAEAKKNSSKLNERTGNVYENKGALWKTRKRSGNVYENTALSRICRNVIENKGG